MESKKPENEPNPNTGKGPESLLENAKSLEERGVEVYYIEGPNGQLVPQYRPKSS